jgi:hypothetical protein
MYRKMQQTSGGWGANDYHTLLKGFGFEWREGRDRVYYLTDHPDMKPLNIARHRQLATGYCTTALKRVAELIAREQLVEN